MLFVKIKYVACKMEYMLPIIAYVNVYDIKNWINTSRSVNLWFQIDRKWVGFGSFLGHFKRFCPLKPRKYEKTIIKLTNVLLFMSLLHGMEQNWINV